MSIETPGRRAGGIRACLGLVFVAASLSACVSANPGAAPDARDPNAFAWAFVAPKAELRDVSGKVVGRHYGGPTWEAMDGSKVQGTLVAQEAAPDPHAIAWLLLRATTNSGSGMFTSVTSIQRIHTKGGTPPEQPCDAARANQQSGSAYTAEYVFYVGKS